MKRLTLAAALVMSSFVMAAPADLARGKVVVDEVCASCHGVDGNNGIAMYPRLSAQHANYASLQAIAIKNGERKTGAADTMFAQVQHLSDDDIRNASAYYAKQLAKSGEANPKANPELGAKIYRSGIAERNVPACMSCHNANGAGIPGGGTNVSAYPRIAGQHGAYVETQLKAYASGERVSPNDMMKDIAMRMTDEDMKAVGNFIQGLK